MRRVLVMVLLAVSSQLSVAEAVAGESQTQFIQSIDRMMVGLAAQTARASATIRKEYRDHLELLVLQEYAELEGALYNGGVVPLPGDPLRFNLKPRVGGMFPIGEKDLANQESYIAARPATVGALLEIASRITSGPLEITSMVRHSEYQDTLRKTNGNANTSIPMHTMGMAFDIALVNTPLETIYEIRDVLRQMQDAGDILVIGERQQLVFHVVPHPSRMGYFTDVYVTALAAAATPGLPVIAASPVRALSAYPVAAVTAEVTAFRPTDDNVAEWWASDDARSDLTVQVAPQSLAAAPPLSFVGSLAARCYAVVAGLFESARQMIA